MPGKTLKSIRPRIALLVLALAMAALVAVIPVLLTGDGQGEAAAGAGRPGASTQPAPAPARPAPAPVTVSDHTFNLCATTGSVTMPDLTDIPIWGFAIKPDDVSCDDVSAQLPGPTLGGPDDTITAGDTVTIKLYNNLAQNVSIVLPGLGMVPDTVGAGPGGTTSYDFTASRPGAFLYEAGTTAQIQVAMGLYGPLIVRPSLGDTFAYNDADSEFDVEAVLVLSEIDPALNADPDGFNTQYYAPKYWLINGKAYPDTAEITADEGDQVLIRYLNAGLVHHTMNLVGLHQTVFAGDAYPLTFSYEAVSLTVASGQTFDNFVTIPLDIPSDTDTLYPLYSANLHVTNVDAFPGGMLTFVSVDAGP